MSFFNQTDESETNEENSESQEEIFTLGNTFLRDTGCIQDS